MIIYLLRHGQSTSDIEDRYGGDYDDHLTELGKEQARNLGKRLQDKGIEILFVSPRIRALETRDQVLIYISPATEVVNDIRECNRYGLITGMIKAEAEAKYPDQVSLLKDYKTKLEGGEDYESFKKRILSAFQAILNTNHQVVAILTHGGPIRCILRELFGIELHRDLEDCEIIEFESKKEKLLLKSNL